MELIQITRAPHLEMFFYLSFPKIIAKVLKSEKSHQFIIDNINHIKER